MMALFLSLQASAQTDGFGTWNVLTTKFTFDKKWTGFAEAQLRSQKIFSDFHYYEYKAGVGYNFPKTLSVMLAMGHYSTFQPDGDFKSPHTDEFRIFEQFGLTNDIGPVKIEHRYRIEQRFISTGEYRNRFRYRINAIIPLNNKEIKNKTLYTSVFNEVFITNEGPYFEQNRIFLGLGYQFNSSFGILAGYINRFDQSVAHIPQWKNFWQTNLIISFAEFKSGRALRPSTMD
jgi:hypothetical protein